MNRFSAMLLMLAVTSCKSSEPTPVAATPASPASSPRIAQVSPPPMSQRQIGPPPATMPAGQLIDIDDNGVKFALFIPQSFSQQRGNRCVLTMHFHGAIWFALQEHLRRGLSGPLLCAALGEGSSVYRKPFEDRQRFGRLV